MPPNTSATGGYLVPQTVPALPPEDRDLTRVFHDIVMATTQLPAVDVMPRWQEEPPLIPAITQNVAFIGVTLVEASLSPYLEFADNVDGGQQNLHRHETMVVMCSFYGPDARGYASKLRDGLAIEQNWEQAHDFGMVLQDVGDIVSMPEQIEGRWYRRVDIELRVNRQINRSYPVRSIQSARGVITADALKQADKQGRFTTENHTENP